MNDMSFLERILYLFRRRRFETELDAEVDSTSKRALMNCRPAD